MTGIELLNSAGRDRAAAPGTQSLVRRALLTCGILSSVLYAFTDLLGGLQYDGYDFRSQAISELAAIGAQSKAFMDPLLTIYQLLALAFGIGVWRVAGRRSGVLRVTASMLILYGAIGLSVLVLGGTTFFAMHQRGSGSMSTDAPHIVLTAVLVLLLLISIGFGAFAFGRRFRAYSLASLLVIVVFGALTALEAPRIDAGLPTPGMGIYERINVYTSMLWIAVLAMTLLRREGPRDARAT